MRKEKVKSFRQWYDDEGQEFTKKPKHSEYKRNALRKESALKRGDIDAYLEDDEDPTW